MVKVIPNQEYFVLIGFWIRTTAGWGRIQKIRADDSVEELLYFNRKKHKPQLTVILRPDHDPEPVRIDLTTREVTFLDARKVYICTKDGCFYFASEKMKHVIKQHNFASHNGIGPSFRPSAPSFEMHNPESYSLEAPENQFA
jgi:hypothetical protein